MEFWHLDHRIYPSYQQKHKHQHLNFHPIPILNLHLVENEGEETILYYLIPFSRATIFLLQPESTSTKFNSNAAAKTNRKNMKVKWKIKDIFFEWYQLI